jgi:hypothetical protein
MIPCTSRARAGSHGNRCRAVSSERRHAFCTYTTCASSLQKSPTPTYTKHRPARPEYQCACNARHSRPDRAIVLNSSQGRARSCSNFNESVATTSIARSRDGRRTTSTTAQRPSFLEDYGKLPRLVGRRARLRVPTEAACVATTAAIRKRAHSSCRTGLTRAGRRMRLRSTRCRQGGGAPPQRPVTPCCWRQERLESLPPLARAALGRHSMISA